MLSADALDFIAAKKKAGGCRRRRLLHLRLRSVVGRHSGRQETAGSVNLNLNLNQTVL